jgi:thiol-disulfide isomerase/thioredoxin
MISDFKCVRKFLVVASIFWLLSGYQANAQSSKDIKITIHLRGVYESKISLLGLSSRTFKPITEVPGIKNGETTQITIPKTSLPGEFVLRFDYKETAASTPYPSEKYIFIYNQDLELWVSPVYCNNADSTWFQEGEKENAAFVAFSKENGQQKEKLGLLQNFLMNYDDTNSKLFKEGIKEYEKRRQTYNQWLKDQTKQDRALFVSTLYGFQYVPQIPFEGTETDRIYNLIDHYFDGIDFNDSLLVKTSEINKWMDGYVNLYGQLSTTAALRDSLFPLAGKTAIEKARKGHPLVYGWMVDYFYNGYESNAIDAGMKILEPYLSDPTCLTSKRQEIARRLKGMETLVAGTKAPNVVLNDSEGSSFELDKYKPQSKYILLLFWSADCSHCVETVDAIYPWLQQTDNKTKVSVVAVSLDETEPEIKKWEQKIVSLVGWRNLRGEAGVRSKVANDYFILATPVMVLIDTKTKEIVAMPNTPVELKGVVK